MQEYIWRSVWHQTTGYIENQLKEKARGILDMSKSEHNN